MRDDEPRRTEDTSEDETPEFRARRSLLRAAVYVPPAIIGTLLISRDAIAGQSSCPPCVDHPQGDPDCPPCKGTTAPTIRVVCEPSTCAPSSCEPAAAAGTSTPSSEE